MRLHEILQKMYRPEFTHEAAIHYAQEVAAKKGKAVVVRLKSKGDQYKQPGLNAFNVFPEDEFNNSSENHKYDLFATVEQDGYVHHHK